MILKDASGTIPEDPDNPGSSIAELVLPKQKQRQYLLIENPSDTEDLWYNFDGTAQADSPACRIGPLDHRLFVGPHCPDGALSVYAATVGQKYTVKHS